jgi:acyl-CoA thioesterase-1
MLLIGLPLTAHAANTILILGDSLSAGYGIAAQDSWPSLMQAELKRSHPAYQVINTSISGETAAGGRQRIHSILQQYKPTIMLLELGANDGLRGSNPNQVSSNLGAIIKATHNSNAQIVLLGIKLPPNYGEPYITQFQKIYSTLAKKHNLPFLPFLLDGVTPEQFQADNLHPTAAAQPIIMRNVLRTLKPLLN